jgi:hypothetical protein
MPCPYRAASVYSWPYRMIAVRCVAVLAALIAVPAAAHEIPASVTAHLFVKAEAQRLRVIARVPMAVLRDVDMPTRGPGYLDLERADPVLRAAAMTWIGNGLRIHEDGRVLPRPRLAAIRVALPSDRSFGRYEDALAHVIEDRNTAATDIYWNQALLDVLLEYPIQSAQSAFAIDSELARLGIRVVTVVRFIQPSGAVRTFEFTGNPGALRLNPRWHHAAARFVRAGFLHILDGIDHLLFLLCLMIPIRRIVPLVGVITAFTAAHSITLIAAALGLAPGALWFPALIETLIAMSIVYMALENIVGARLRTRWVVAFGFGLVHGFGFSFALRDSLQFAGSHLLTALLFFNAGVELGQVVVLLVLVPALQIVFRYVVPERIGIIVLSALIAHTGWHWMIDRGETLRQFQFVWPGLTVVAVGSALWWLTIAIVVGGLGWVTFLTVRAARSGPASARLSWLSARFRRKAAGSS